jgi:guanine nucleotide-binding protein subunit beta-2-like 1 protein
MSKDTRLSVEYIGSLRGKAFFLILLGHNGWVTCLAVGSDDNNKPLLVSGSRDRSLIVWKLNLDEREEIITGDNSPADWKLGKPFRALRGHSHFVSAVAMARDNKHVVSASWGKFFYKI